MRSRKDRAEVIDTFGKHNVDVIAVKGPSLDLRSAYGRAMGDIMTAFDSMGRGYGAAPITDWFNPSTAHQRL
jgi:hypothetical protein